MWERDVKRRQPPYMYVELRPGPHLVYTAQLIVIPWSTKFSSSLATVYSVCKLLFHELLIEHKMLSWTPPTWLFSLQSHPVWCNLPVCTEELHVALSRKGDLMQYQQSAKQQKKSNHRFSMLSVTINWWQCNVFNMHGRVAEFMSLNKTQNHVLVTRVLLSMCH